MNLSATPSLIDKLADSFLVIDTCVLIDAIKTDDFRELIEKAKDKDCELFSIRAVKHEFLRGSHTIKEYSDYQDFLNKMEISFISDIEHKLDTEAGKTFALVFNQYYRNKHLNKQPSYVDMLLLFTTYYYARTVSNVRLLTANHHDVPGFFKRTSIVVFETNNEIRTEALYEFDSDRFSSRLDLLLQS